MNRCVCDYSSIMYGAKLFIVSWWNGQDAVRADDENSARSLVRRFNAEYRAYGRRAPLFVKEVIR